MISSAARPDEEQNWDDVNEKGINMKCKKLHWLCYPFISLGHLTLVYGDKEDIVSSFLLEVTSRISTGQIGDSPVVSKGILFAIGDKDPSWIKTGA